LFIVKTLYLKKGGHDLLYFYTIIWTLSLHCRFIIQKILYNPWCKLGGVHGDHDHGRGKGEGGDSNKCGSNNTKHIAS